MSLSRKAQGSLEYLVIIAAVLLVSGVVVYFLAGNTKSSVSTVNLEQCRNAAEHCGSVHLVNAHDPCNFCENACTVNGVDILNPNCSLAVSFCQSEQVEEIYKGHSYISFCSNDSQCDDGDVCTIDSCAFNSSDNCYMKCQNILVGPNPSDADGCCQSGWTHNDDADCADNSPVLLNGGVSVDNGLTEPDSTTSSRSPTTFVFTVTYKDVDNDAPDYVRVLVASETHDMSKVDSNCNDYVAGCEYSVAVTIPSPSGEYSYSFKTKNAFSSEVSLSNVGTVTAYVCSTDTHCPADTVCKNYYCSSGGTANAQCKWSAKTGASCGSTTYGDWYCCGSRVTCGTNTYFNSKCRSVVSHVCSSDGVCVVNSYTSTSLCSGESRDYCSNGDCYACNFVQ